jgi:Protein of unknown function (DUF2934)
MDEQRLARIAQRVDEIYLSRAGMDQHGSAEEDWRQAEEELSTDRVNSPVSTEPDPD